MSLLPDRHIRALLLDAMGTLIHLEPPGPILRHQLQTRWAIDISPVQAEQAMSSEIAYYRAHMHCATDAQAVERLRQESAEALRDALPAHPRLAEVGTLELTAALLSSLRWEPYPDAPRALDQARRHGLSVVVVSNWDASLPDVLGAVGLADRVDAVITSAVAGAAKPDGRIFDIALDAVSVRPEQALHVGDSWEEDVLGAQAVGVQPVWLRRAGAPAPGNVTVVDSLVALFASA